MREPGTLPISKWLNEVSSYKTFDAVILAWASVSVLLCPYFYKVYEMKLFRLWHTALQGAKPEFFYTLWTVHATILGIFLVLLTFLFQFISLRLAYETSLLPFLARKSHLSVIIITNFVFIGFGMIQGLLQEHSRFQPASRWIIISGLLFALLSAAFLLYRLLDLLSVEKSLKMCDWEKATDAIREWEAAGELPAGDDGKPMRWALAPSMSETRLDNLMCASSRRDSNWFCQPHPIARQLVLSPRHRSPQTLLGMGHKAQNQFPGHQPLH
jgi:hypothetical protein